MEFWQSIASGNGCATHSSSAREAAVLFAKRWLEALAALRHVRHWLRPHWLTMRGWSRPTCGYGQTACTSLKLPGRLALLFPVSALHHPLTRGTTLTRCMRSFSKVAVAFAGHLPLRTTMRISSRHQQHLERWKTWCLSLRTSSHSPGRVIQAQAN